MAKLLKIIGVLGIISGIVGFVIAMIPCLGNCSNDTTTPLVSTTLMVIGAVGIVLLYVAQFVGGKAASNQGSVVQRNGWSLERVFVVVYFIGLALITVLVLVKGGSFDDLPGLFLIGVLPLTIPYLILYAAVKVIQMIFRR